MLRTILTPFRELKVTQLYRDYKALSEANNKSFVKESMYRYIFNTQFNISFFTPKKDQCEECESNKNNDNEQYDNTSFLKHLEEKHLAREEKEVDKKRSSIELVCAVYDLQAVLTVPRGDVSVFYYISKVANYNFTVCEIQSMEAICYLWHEGEAHRGPNEIASCLFKFIQKKSEERTNDFEIIFYSDNCGGQNKNKFIIGLYQYALKVFPNVKTITHKFLIRGHTQNEGDSVHSVIEKQIKLSLKSSPIYTAYQYAQIIRDSKKKAPFFKVDELDHSNFFNFKDYTSRIGNNFNINTNSESIHFNDIKVLKLSRGQTDTFKYKTSYKEDTFKTINFARKRKTRVSQDLMVVDKAYLNPCGIAPKKKEDLMKLCSKNHIPPSFQSFYRNL